MRTLPLTVATLDPALATLASKTQTLAMTVTTLSSALAISVSEMRTLTPKPRDP